MNYQNTAISNINALSCIDSSNADLQTGDDLVYNLVDDIFQLGRCHYEESDSEPCSEPLSRSSKHFVDRRLQYWKDMLRQRRLLQHRLSLETGKQPQEIIFNKDYRKEQSIRHTQTINLDFVNSTSTESKDFKSKCKSYIEIVGMPRRATLELLEGTMSSKVNKLSETSEHASNEKSLIEFCPKIQRLEVIGKNNWGTGEIEHDSMYTISSTTSGRDVTLTPHWTTTRGTMTATKSIIINGINFSLNDPNYSPILEKMFVCNPFEFNLRTIIIIENNGQLPINFYWKRSQFFAYNDTLFIGEGHEFIFDTEPFQLRSGEVRKVNVLFRPSKVGIVKQRWMLRTKPKIFHAPPCALTLNMHGRCTPPVEYLERLECMMKIPFRKCRNFSEMHRQFNRSLNPVSEIAALCPYARELEEREAFNQRNVGFHCQRQSDLIDIKVFFNQVKPETCDIEWDFSISMLIDLLYYKETEIQRVALFSKLRTLLESLRGRSFPLDLSDDQAKLAERQRTRFIFVRGIIANNIELWEEKIWALGAQMLKSSQFKELNKLIYSKPFRDSIYIYTYDQLCNVIEDIVSVIESTEHV